MANLSKSQLASLKICLVVLLSVIITVGSVPNPSLAFSDPAISTLRSQVNGLRVRIARLEGEIRNLNRNLSRNPVNRSTPPTRVDRSQQSNIESNDTMFQRLATLVIELKEDVRDLDNRLKKVENTIY